MKLLWVTNGFMADFYKNFGDLYFFVKLGAEKITFAGMQIFLQSKIDSRIKTASIPATSFELERECTVHIIIYLYILIVIVLFYLQSLHNTYLSFLPLSFLPTHFSTQLHNGSLHNMYICIDRVHILRLFMCWFSQAHTICVHTICMYIHSYIKHSL